MFNENLKTIRKEKGFSQEQVDVVAAELAKLNELLVVYAEKASSMKIKIKKWAGTILIIISLRAMGAL